MTDALFQDRRGAGRALAQRLSGYADRPDVRVLALPRGGVPVGFEVGQALHAPLDVLVVRKLGAPDHEELALGAIAPGVCHVNQRLVQELCIDPERLDRIVEQEQVELARRERLYREGRPPLDVHGACVIVVDDGLATGATMRAAVLALRAMAPARVVVAVPVAAQDTCAALRCEADEVVCVATPYPFVAVGLWYRDFSQTSDDEVRDLLAQAASP
ncbi:phosphoribosyltransferase [Hydrogenophaga sp. 2FB]|uniref:phosphoribosyltransferase n=1 Tax=Hydrogenophaga sp. 2FB TaxID=2502187 RepID=UPI0010F8CC0B|nr:phosphoribosyltransferase [Hydrogenophaga sp. 2FB]